MTGNNTGKTGTSGMEPSEMERFMGRWPDELAAQAESLLPEGKGCYGDWNRAEVVKASYARLADEVATCQAGEPLLLVGRRPLEHAVSRNSDFSRRIEPPPPYTFRRTIVLGELAGSGAGIFLDFRAGQIVFPTLRYAQIQRDSLTAATKYHGPELQEGILESNTVLNNQGLLPPRGDLMDSPLYTKLSGNGLKQKHSRLRSAQRTEMWYPIADIAVGRDNVDALMDSLERRSLNRMKKPYENDFSLLRGMLE